MHEIEVHTTGSQEASDGVVELARDGEQIAYHPRDGSLILRIDPRRDGTPLRIDVRGLREALAEVERVLGLY